jgi:hydroxymethylpyrimidine kinase/phosphomethylpyrimidine kinase
VQPACALTIAGSDSGGGAGIQADLRTFAALGVHGAVALTAVTAQNTHEVTAVCALEAEMVTCQVLTVLSDLPVRAVKTGMLARPATVRAVGALARAGRLPQLVVDPVLVSSSGHPLMEIGGVEAYRHDLLPHALVATPNLREAAVLTDRDVATIRTVPDMIDVGEAIRQLGPRYVLVKGGHFTEDTDRDAAAPDVLVGPGGPFVLEAVRVVTRNDHGTGCSLAAACAARLAQGDDVPTAVETAKTFVLEALRSAATWTLGRGHGPIDHLGWSR